MRCSHQSALIAAITALLLSGAGTADAAGSAVWSSSAPFGSWTEGGYTLNNDVWGSGAGPQTIWANSHSNWGVTSTQPATGGVKSYPHAEYDFNKKLTGITTISSSFDVTVPGSGVYNTSYDIWLNNSAVEVMLWLNERGAVALGSEKQAVDVGGYSWKLYSGSNGTNKVYSFVNTGQAVSGSVNVLAALNWLQNGGWLGTATATLGNVQFGFEITSTGSTATAFTAHSYTVSTS